MEVCGLHCSRWRYAFFQLVSIGVLLLLYCISIIKSLSNSSFFSHPCILKYSFSWVSMNSVSLSFQKWVWNAPHCLLLSAFSNSIFLLLLFSFYMLMDFHVKHRCEDWSVCRSHSRLCSTSPYTCRNNSIRIGILSGTTVVTFLFMLSGWPPSHQSPRTHVNVLSHITWRHGAKWDATWPHVWNIDV